MVRWVFTPARNFPETPSCRMTTQPDAQEPLKEQYAIFSLLDIRKNKCCSAQSGGKWRHLFTPIFCAMLTCLHSRLAAAALSVQSVSILFFLLLS